MFVATQAFAATPINCRAYVTYSYNDQRPVVKHPKILETTFAPDKNNTIVAPRESGMLLSITFSEDGSTATDTSNYIYRTHDGRTILSENNIPLDISNGSVSFTHTISESTGPNDNFVATFVMSCVRVQQ